MLTIGISCRRRRISVRASIAGTMSRPEPPCPLSNPWKSTCLWMHLSSANHDRNEDLDNLVADQLALGDSTGDLRNMHNNPIDRYASQSSRRVGRAEKARRGRTLEEHV